jgi:mannose-6-phosphate isomerase-like protein (cupin superfamily)
MRQAVLAITVFFGTAALAQAPARSNTPANQETVVTAEQLQSMLAAAPISKDTGKPAELSSQLFGRVASCSFIRLNDPDLPHVHPVSEIYVMKEGSATIETGGTMIGPFTNGGVHHQAGATGGQPGQAAQQPAQPIGPDHGGTALEGGRAREVKAGDVILIPAGVNHHWTKISQPLVYLDIKFPKAE